MGTRDRAVLFCFLIAFLFWAPFSTIAETQSPLGDACHDELLTVQRSHKTFSLRADGLVEVRWKQTVRARREPLLSEESASINRLCIALSEYEAERLVAFTGVRELPTTAHRAIEEDYENKSRLRIRPCNDSTGIPRSYVIERYRVARQSDSGQSAQLLRRDDNGGHRVEIELSYVLARSLCPLAFATPANEVFREAQSISKDALVQRFRFHMDSIGVQSIYPVEEQQFLISRNSMTKDVRSRLVGVPEGIEPAKILGPVSDAEKPAPSDAEPDFELEYGPFSERDSADLATAFVDFTFESVTGLGPTDFAISAMALAGTFRALSAKREVAVSHRGWLQVKEMMTLLNDYPETHPGAWSRLDYLIALQQNSFASRTIQEFLAVIPLAARHIFYRDITGNISTSSLRPLSHLLAPLEQFRKWQTPEGKLVLQSLAAKRDTHQLLALRPRFPLAPSWRTNIEFGYDVPLRGQRYWKSLGGNVFQLRYPLTPPFHGLIIDDLDLKVILPNAARVLHIDTPDDRHLYHISIEHQSGYGHLDFVPRTVVRFRRKNVVTDLSPPTDSQIEIRYTVGSFNAIWLKPLIILGYTVIALAVIVILSRVNFSIQKQ